MERILEQIRIWKQIPSYQAERRIDIFFGVFLKRILIGMGYFTTEEEDDITLIPEFPQPTLNESKYMRSVKIDYIAVSSKKLYAIELKTDAHSIRPDQIAYYKRFMNQTWSEHKHFVTELEQASKAKDKYQYLQDILSDTKYPNEQKPNEVIYIAPDNSVLEDFKIIRFKDIAGLPSDNDKLFELFKETLNNWDK